jgi:hypothetical protein
MNHLVLSFRLPEECECYARGKIAVFDVFFGMAHKPYGILVVYLGRFPQKPEGQQGVQI